MGVRHFTWYDTIIYLLYCVLNRYVVTKEHRSTEGVRHFTWYDTIKYLLYCVLNRYVVTLER